MAKVLDLTQALEKETYKLRKAIKKQNKAKLKQLENIYTAILYPQSLKQQGISSEVASKIAEKLNQKFQEKNQEIEVKFQQGKTLYATRKQMAKKRDYINMKRSTILGLLTKFKNSHPEMNVDGSVDNLYSEIQSALETSSSNLSQAVNAQDFNAKLEALFQNRMVSIFDAHYTGEAFEELLPTTLEVLNEIEEKELNNFEKKLLQTLPSANVTKLGTKKVTKRINPKGFSAENGQFQVKTQYDGTSKIDVQVLLDDNLMSLSMKNVSITKDNPNIHLETGSSLYNLIFSNYSSKQVSKITLDEFLTQKAGNAKQGEQLKFLRQIIAAKALMGAGVFQSGQAALADVFVINDRAHKHVYVRSISEILGEIYALDDKTLTSKIQIAGGHSERNRFIIEVDKITDYKDFKSALINLNLKSKITIDASLVTPNLTK